MEYIEYIDEETKSKHVIYKDPLSSIISGNIIYNCKYCEFVLVHLATLDIKVNNKYHCLNDEEKIIKDLID